MKRIITFFILLLTFCSVSKAQQAAITPADIQSLRYMSMQHQQTIKTFDTYAREQLFFVTGKSSRDGKTAAEIVLDMILDPQPKIDENLIYIRNKPFRQDFVDALKIEQPEKDRVIQKGTISLSYFMKPDVQDKLGKLMASSTIKAKAVRELQEQAGTLAQLLDYPHFRGTFFYQAFIPPTDSETANQKPWETLPDAAVHVLEHPEHGSQQYAAQLTGMIKAIQGLSTAWKSKDSAGVKQNADELGKLAGEINPKIYPTHAKRKFEILYNSLSRLTWPGAALYILGFVFFLLSWTTGSKWMYITGWATSLIALAVHCAAIVIRWWLVQKNIDHWWHAIPIKNQFESVMFSAFFGTIVALILEAGVVNWFVKKVFRYDAIKLHGYGIFGLAGAGIGMLSLVALFTVPYVTGSDIIGGGIRQNAGILMTYWLYIHVTLVTASYALIGMTFIIGVWYTIQYLFNSEASILKTLDLANLAMLQLAFWVLAIGIITGALWADVSWGRPWGWDPKETFALITWIVYLIIVHVRFVTSGEKRALITSVLSVIGFFVMLFNWIGVNFFLVGLHSYA